MSQDDKIHQWLSVIIEEGEKNKGVGWGGQTLYNTISTMETHSLHSAQTPRIYDVKPSVQDPGLDPQVDVSSLF